MIMMGLKLTYFLRGLAVNRIDPAKVLRSPRLFLLYWLSINGVVIDRNGKLRYEGGELFSSGLDTINLDYLETLTTYNLGRSVPVGEFKLKLLRIALNELVIKELVTYRETTQIKVIDSVDMFIVEHKICKPLPRLQSDLRVSSVYPRYKAWCESKGLEVRVKFWLCKKIRALGIVSQVRRANGELNRVYVVASDCTLLGHLQDGLEMPKIGH